MDHFKALADRCLTASTVFGTVDEGRQAISSPGRIKRMNTSRLSILVPGSGASIALSGTVSSDGFQSNQTLFESQLGELFIPAVAALPGKLVICWPTTLTMTRYLHVPVANRSEVGEMVPHLLAGELPIPVEALSWQATALNSTDTGLLRILARAARIDHLDQCAEPYVQAGAKVAGFLPESTVWAKSLVESCDKATSENVDRDDGASDSPGFCQTIDAGDQQYTLVGHNGVVCFEHVTLAQHGNDPIARSSATDLYEAEFGRPLPEAVIFKAPSKESPQDIGTLLRNAVAPIHVGSNALLSTPTLRSKNNAASFKQLTLRTSLVLVAGILASVLGLYGIQTHTNSQIDRNTTELAENAEVIAELESKYETISLQLEAEPVRDPCLAFIGVLQTLDVKDILYNSFNYQSPESVQLSGSAPSTATVLQLSEDLREQALVQDVEIRHIKTVSGDNQAYVQFALGVRIQASEGH